ncbi:GlcG/HbpS family heme-binding protein [Halalkalibacter nanhaiisediminis]|uniref:Uncharacterized protein GlcG (DUF336 family) n=1 Tax=Halalkalibacter nanhaiisediminis TaxID=688079 RepID=A0A562QQL6_9BACI|nr:heme-binding protein [Halalkalibacter nanhaiisediminis]TWI59051.1 uncharacterized protein GlcG (DUF336 family) [Halalkalibacter nanhaiisediminis]
MVKITLSIAKQLIEAAEYKAKTLGVSQVISIVDEGGNLVALTRMDGAWLASIDIAQNKAWTAVSLQMPTSALAKIALPTGELFGINTTNQGRVVVLGGGIPLRQNGNVVGAVGVSGSTIINDVKVAKAAVQAFEHLYGFNVQPFPHQAYYY